MENINRGWGTEKTVINEPEYCWKMLFVKPGHASSKHFHSIKKETFVVLEGSCFLALWDKPDGPTTHHLMPWLPVTIPAGVVHKFWVHHKDPQCIIYEISMHHSEDDVVRLSKSGPYDEVVDFE